MFHSINSSRAALIVLAAVLGLATMTAAAAAAPPPTPLSACQTISASGNYVVTTNLSATGDCFVPANNAIGIDLKKHTITGNGTGSGVGNNVSFLKNIVIVNGTITGFGDGIFLAGGVSQVTRQYQFFEEHRSRRRPLRRPQFRHPLDLQQ